MYDLFHVKVGMFYSLFELGRDWSNKETQNGNGNGNGFGCRVLMSLKEKPSGSNLTFECTPSGPSVPCLY